jgi:hypothetical protein
MTNVDLLEPRIASTRSSIDLALSLLIVQDSRCQNAGSLQCRWFASAATIACLRQISVSTNATV